MDFASIEGGTPVNQIRKFMKKFRSFLGALCLALIMLAMPNCGGGQDTGPDLDQPSVTLLEGPAGLTGIIAEGGSVSLKLKVQAPNGFQVLKVQSSLTGEETISEGSQTFEYLREVSTADKSPGLETLTFVVVDLLGRESEALVVNLRYRRPASNRVGALDNLLNGGDLASLIDLSSGEVYSLEKIVSNPPLKALVDFCYYSLEISGERFLSPAAEVSADLLWADGVRNETIFKVVSQDLFDQMEGVGELERVLLLDQIFEEAAGGESAVNLQPFISEGKAFSFRTAEGLTGIMTVVNPNQTSVAFSYWINQL